MAIYTYTPAEVAGMIERLDDEGGAGTVLLVADKQADVDAMLATLRGCLGGRVARRRRSQGRQAIVLSSGLEAKAIRGEAKGYVARLAVCAPGVGEATLCAAGHAARRTGGSLVVMVPHTPIGDQTPTHEPTQTEPDGNEPTDND